MEKRTASILLGSTLILISFFAQPLPVESQCMVTNTVSIPAPSPTSPYNVVYKYLNGTYQCNRVASNNASLCAPGTAPLPRTMLTASANTTATNPSCQFYCTGGCGTITIDKNDGLPVELMEFEIAEDHSGETATEVAAADSDATGAVGKR